MKSAVIARSVTINGHKTSLSLERPFWEECLRIADGLGLSLEELLSQIDAERLHGNLASAVRLYVLDDVKRRASLSPRRPRH